MRRAKQIIYGVFYFIVAAGIFTLFYVRFLQPAPASICTTCLPADLQPITAGTVSVFAPTPSSTADAVTLLVRVANWNTSVGADTFDYAFTLHNASGTNLGSVSGSSFMYPNETKYIVIPNAAVSGTVASADFGVGGVHWIASSTAGMAPQFTFKNVVTAPLAGSSSTLVATGEITNDDLAVLANITVVAIFKDQYGNPAGVSQTVIDSLQPQETQNFSVAYPAAANISLAETEMEAYTWR